MANFKYKALNQDKSIIVGVVEAANETSAADILKEKQLVILSLSGETSGLNFNISLDRIKPKDLVVFSRQFSVLISANVALVQSLEVLVSQTENQKLKKVLSEVADEIDGGSRLSDALGKRPKVFSSFFVNVVKSGETSGKLDEILDYLADELEKDYDMTSKIKGAMIYPAFVMTGMSVVGAVMMVFVVPKLTEVLSQSGVALPLPTKILIAVSGILAVYWWLIIIGIIGLVIAFKFFIATNVGKRIFDVVLLRLPIFGSLFRKIYLVRFTRSLQTLLVGGVNISKGLKITSEVVTNTVYSDLILETRSSIEDGSSISEVFLRSKDMPGMVSQMMSIGEKTGKLDVILDRITKFYTREIDNTVDNLMTLMEPIIMVVMGVAVGIMVAAIILPMYNMSAGT
jgi:type II secretory pathway component PulF